MFYSLVDGNKANQANTSEELLYIYGHSFNAVSRNGTNNALDLNSDDSEFILVPPAPLITIGTGDFTFEIWMNIVELRTSHDGVIYCSEENNAKFAIVISTDRNI